MMSRSVVVQDDPRRRGRRRLWFILALLATFLLGVVASNYSSLYLGMEAALENRQLRADIIDQAIELEELRQWQINNRTRRDIDKAALELVRQELASQQEAISELERGLRFYKSLMAPGEVAEGLSVRSVDIKPGPDPERFEFRILVQQSARKHELLTGTLSVEVIGEENGVSRSYKLSDLSEQVPSADIRLRFKYFQAIDGELVLPAGFTPRMLRASARSTKPSRAEFTNEFPWSIQEKLSHVGQ